MSDVLVAPTYREMFGRPSFVDVPMDAPDTGDVEFEDLGSVVIETPDVMVSISQGLGAAAELDAPGVDFLENLADRLSESDRAALASFILQGVEDDLESRSEWEETANRAAQLLGIRLENPTTSVSADGTVCKAIATCMLEACVKLWGVARGELLPAGGPVRVGVNGAAKAGRQAARLESAAGLTAATGVPGGLSLLLPDAEQDLDLADDELASALQQDMNAYLTVVDREYYPDFRQMLFSKILIGNAFRKVYRCPIRRRPTSRWVRAQNLIVSNDCTHLSGAGRVTERISMSQSTMRRLQKTGHYLDVDLVLPSGHPTDTQVAVGDSEGVDPTPKQSWDAPHTVYECYLDLDDTSIPSMMGDLSALNADDTGHVPGFPLPYRVTVDMDSRQVLEIRRDWKRGDPDYRRRETYVKYGAIPGLGFYDLGLIHLVGNPTLYASMLERAIVDSTLYANFPGGIMMRNGGRAPQTIIRPNPGEWVPVDTGGAQRVQDAFMALPYRAPSAEELALLAKMEEDVRRIAGVISLPLGEAGLSNVPVGTIMSYMEQVTQVPGAIHKDDHIAQAHEFELLRQLFIDDPSALWRGRRSPARKWAVSRELEDVDLIPAADPNVPSQQHRIMQTQALVALAGSPQFAGVVNQRKVFEWGLRVLGIEDIEGMMTPPQPPGPPAPDPKLMAAQMKADTERQKGQQRMQAETLKHQGDMAEIQAKSADNAAQRQVELMKTAAQVGAEEMRVQAEAARDQAKMINDQAESFADRDADQRRLEAEMDAAERDRQAAARKGAD